MFLIGSHLSSAKGFYHMGETALKIGANTFQFFTRNPRGGNAKALDPEDAGRLAELMREHGFGPVIAHASYTMNACSADPKIREFVRRTMADDLDRLEHLPGCLYNFHPGSHVGQGAEAGIAQIAETLNQVMRPEQRTTVLLETMAGKGTEVGGRFEELRDILERVECKERMGVCLDTCHVFDGGYDIVGNLEGVLEEFDRIVGLDRLKAVHLNDSQNELGSHKDRHAKLGKGKIGLDALLAVTEHPALYGLPFALETPNDLDGYANEIRIVREHQSHIHENQAIFFSCQEEQSL